MLKASSDLVLIDGDISKKETTVQVADSGQLSTSAVSTC